MPSLYFRSTVKTVCPTCRTSTRPRSPRYVAGTTVHTVGYYHNAKYRNGCYVCDACVGHDNGRAVLRSTFNLEHFDRVVAPFSVRYVVITFVNIIRRAHNLPIMEQS